MPVGVPGREMGCILRGGGCWGVELDSEVPWDAEPSPGRIPCADSLNPSTMVGWRSGGGCLVDPFKDGTDWFVVKLTGGLLDLETEVCGDVLIGGRIGRVGVVDVDVEPAENDGEELKVLDVDFVSVDTAVVDDSVPKGRPGVKVGALGSSTAEV